MQQVLHVGCGPARLNSLPAFFQTGDWQEIRLDIDQDVQPDVVGTILDMALIADESVDAVYSSHNIEHVFPHEVLKALYEFNRVLRVDGLAIIRCPNMQAVAKAVAEGNLMDPLYISPAGPIAAIDMIYGHRPAIAAGQFYMAHKTGFTPGSLATQVNDAGFATAVVAEDMAYTIHCLAYKGKRSSDAMEDDCSKCFPPRNDLLSVIVHS